MEREVTMPAGSIYGACTACRCKVWFIPESDSELGVATFEVLLCPRCGHLMGTLGNTPRDLTQAEKAALPGHVQASLIRAKQQQIISWMWG